MKVDAGLDATLAEVPARIAELEERGFDAAITTETSHEPFFPLLLAAEHSRRIELMTSIVVAFARNPMTTAIAAHDLQAYSRGRFLLGLGSQIKPHITKRFSMPWSHPAARMREFILALRAIWANWYSGEALDFRGEFYTHTLMTPFFTPTDTQHGAPKVILAAVGPLMTEVAAEVADGMIAHGFTTRAYMEQVTLPSIERGLAKGGRRREDFQFCYPAFVVSGRTAEEMGATRRAVCKQIAFYGSTPAYRGVLEIHGWGELQDELNAMSKRGLWDEMGERIGDEVLREFAVVAEPDELAGALLARFGGMVDRVVLGLPFLGADQQASVLARLKSA
ncbi:MAG TPA: TIGR03617 family F420-dependent LLM class oxidoreductase [Thermoanaerobaculia bacterium]|nr:TIGR03617 family F420-dependent LLM class oxidoreductase [Thermoanaerobaculia bacterium]